MDAARDMFAAGLANGFSSCVLNPSDVTKIRLQSPGGPALYPSFAHCVKQIVIHEGASALWRTGLTASMLREATYSSTRMGLYPHVKRQLGTSDSNFAGKLAAGVVTGGLGSVLANPIDVVKCTIMAEAGARGPDGRFTTGLRAGHSPTWPSTFAGLQAVFVEGQAMRGLSACVSRGMLMAAVQLGTYDHSKHLIKKMGLMEDGPKLHIVSSQISAVCACLVTAPTDFMKTRLMADHTGRYRGLLHCLTDTVRDEGIIALWRGAFPTFLRLGPHFLMTFPIYEAVRKWLGLGYL
jgi:solute carrier family 25 protein 14/30